MQRKAVWAAASLAAALMFGGVANAATYVHSEGTEPGVVMTLANLQLSDVSSTPTTVVDRDPTLSVTPTPEPATWAILILGLGMLGAAARRRRGSPAVEA